VTGSTYDGVRERLRPYQGLAILLLFALLIRLAIAPYGGYEYDLDMFRSWAVQLTNERPWDFYELAPPPDKLPGDLWLLWGVGRVYRLFSDDPQMSGEGFAWLIKFSAALGDIAAGAIVYAVVARLGGRRTGMLAAGAYLFNPASIYLASVWGQLDSIPLAAALGGVALFLRGPRWVAFPAVAFAALIKPQYAALIPILVLAAVWLPREAASGRAARGRWRRGAIDIGAGAVLSLALAVAILLPYGVGWPPLGEWSILERVQVAVDKWPFASLYALNLWAAVDPPVRGLVPDSKEWLLDVSYRNWGVALTGASYLAILAMYAWKRDMRTLLWALAATMFVLFLFPTRVHERYAFPVIGLLALLFPYGPGYRLLYAGVSIACLVNLYFAYSLFDPPSLVATASRSRFFYTYVSLLNVAIFLVLAGLVAAGRRGERVHVPAAVEAGD